MSARKEIRKFIQTLLTNGATGADGRVFTNRLKALEEERLPAITIRTMRETATRLNEAKVRYERILTLMVVCVARADDGIDDILDDMAEAVETIILRADVNNQFKNGYGEHILNRIELADTDMTLDLGNSEFGGVAVTFNVNYDSVYEPTLDNLEGFNVEVKAAGAADILFSDTIDTQPP